MQSTLVVNDWIEIPRSELIFTYARSSGPGGQNVNKVNTKAQLRWNVRDSAALSSEVRSRLTAQCKRRINDRGELVISSDRWREQGRNTSECLTRLRALVLAAAEAPRVRKKTRPSRSSNEARLRKKRELSEKKASRRNRPEL